MCPILTNYLKITIAFYDTPKHFQLWVGKKDVK